MLTINEIYSSVYKKLEAIQTSYFEAESRLTASGVQDELIRAKRIENLRVQLEKIEDFKEKVGYFKHMAEKHIESKNLLTITPRELNFNRMRNWAMMIDPDETDDPYAQRIYVQAKCNEAFLDIKQTEFTKTLDILISGKAEVDEELRAEIEATKKLAIEQCREILEGEEFSLFAHMVTETHLRNSNLSQLQTVVTEVGEEDITVSFGIYARPLAVLEELKYIPKAKLGDHYDIKNNRVLLPAELFLNRDVVLSVGCTAAKEKKLYSGLQNYLLNVISKTEIGSRKIYFIDALHYNNTALGALRPLEGTIAIEPIPKNTEQITDTLKQIVADFSDIDETLGMVDSVVEFNETANSEDRLKRTILILLGYPSAFSNEAKEYIKRILLNYEHYGITPVLVDTQYVPKRDDDNGELSVDIAENLFRIKMIQKSETMNINKGKDYPFKWYGLSTELSPGFVEEVKSHDMRAGEKGNEYIKRVDISVMPKYERGKKNIVLPYGVDSKDDVHSISFDNENFASYLMGASGSGKSTLLHTLITGIIHRYHPDDVELWLADFKMSEFAQYMNPMPPHVKYILLDESQELVYDLIDKLTEKMMERQRFFMKHREMKKVENVPTNIYMPVIFVILDEFSIMSQSVSESDSYKLKLQNLLAKGRALGIKFLFSSQTFLSGIQGLTTTAKAQIQSRIAMKNSKDEINETLELSSNLKTDQVKNWIDALPPHYALYKFRDGDRVDIKRLLVMYFAGKGEEAFAPQRRVIEYLNDTMTPVAERDYNPAIINTYVNKDPVIVDGNSYAAFNQEELSERFIDYRRTYAGDVANEDILISFGTPRRMSNYKMVCLTAETRENILLVGRTTEQAAVASIILSAIRACYMQDVDIEIWAYSKNRLFKTYKDVFKKHGCKIIEGIDDISNRIYELKQDIINKKADRRLVIMIGMERICMDFEFIEGTTSQTRVMTFTEKRAALQNTAAVVSDDIDEAVRQRTAQWISEKSKIKKDCRVAGKSKEETEKIIAERLAKVNEDIAKIKKSKPEEKDVPRSDVIKEEPSPDYQKGAYNAREDFIYIVKQGSRTGCHFMLDISDFSDLKQMGLKIDLFRHRMAFQVSVDDSRSIFNHKQASLIPERVCQFDDGLDRYSFRPYIHKDISWDGWFVDDNGRAVEPFVDTE